MNEEMKSPNGIQRQSPVGGFRDFVPPKLKQNVKIANNFFTFFVEIFRFNE